MNGADNTTVAAKAGADVDERLSQVMDAYLCALEEGGIPPDVEEFVAANPDLADEIRSYAKSLELVHRMTAGLAPPSSAAPDQARKPSSNARQLGDFVITDEIGRGGMGVVYEARQISLNRRVALKVLPFAAMLDEKQIARFRNEAQAAALLHHPNIVPVYAIGEERGVHFFAMQYVPGRSLEDVIAEMRIAERGEHPPASQAPTVQWRGRGSNSSAGSAGSDATDDAPFSTQVASHSRTHCESSARLIQKAAEAIHHAHELGVIHRDVKPSNLLVDRDGKLWVTDFGLARIQAGPGVTVSGDVVGTLRYMSPEQVSGQSALVDARTDVYSLGATLYELLTLEPVSPGQERHEILRRIESCEPTAPRKLNASIPADLETVVLRALAKNRDERYPTAQALADDLRRFLAGEPTMARPPALMDRAFKWAIRRRKTVAVAALFLVTVTTMSAVAAVLLQRESQEREKALESARTNLARAEMHFRQARDVVDRFGVGLASTLQAVPGTELLRRQLLAGTLDYYEDFIDQAAEEPGFARDQASALLKAATIAQALGEGDDALAWFREAAAIFERLSADHPRDGGLVAELARSINGEALLLTAAGKNDEALAAYQRALKQLETPLRRGAGGECFEALAETNSNLGLLQSSMGRPNDARKSLAAAIEILEKLSTRTAPDPEHRRALATAYNTLGIVQRQFDERLAEQSIRRAIDVLESLAEDEGEDFGISAQADLALCYNNLGAIQGRLGDWQGAAVSHRAAIEWQRKLVRMAPAVVAHRRDLAATLNNLGQSRRAESDSAGALAAFGEAGDIAAQLASDYPRELEFHSLAGAIRNNRAMALESLGKLDEAIREYEAAVAEQRAAFDAAPQIAEYREALSKHYFNLGRALRSAGQPQDAADAALERRELWPAHGEHLGQVAVELAQAASMVQDGDSTAESREAAATLKRQAAETVQAAADAGFDVQKLAAVGIFEQLPASTAVGESEGESSSTSRPPTTPKPQTRDSVRGS